MKKIVKSVEKVVTVDVEVFVASDGKQFDNKHECEAYEKELSKAKVSEVNKMIYEYFMTPSRKKKGVHHKELEALGFEPYKNSFRKTWEIHNGINYITYCYETHVFDSNKHTYNLVEKRCSSKYQRYNSWEKRCFDNVDFESILTCERNKGMHKERRGHKKRRHGKCWADGASDSVNEMKRALSDREYHKKYIDEEDERHQTAIKKIEEEYKNKLAHEEHSHKFNNEYHGEYYNKALDTIDRLLKRNTSSEV